MKIPLWLFPQSLRDASRFYRTHTLSELVFQKGISFSQEGEDIILQKCFFPDQDEGFYVDVGAFDPVHFSNTHIFYQKGWSGINIEPNHAGFERFKKSRQRDINLNLAVSHKVMEVPFTVDSVFSRIDLDALARPISSGQAKRNTVGAKPLSLILDQYLPENTPIDFLSIDCEGHDRIILESNNWDLYRPKIVLVEDTDRARDAEITRYMMGKRYALFFHLHLTKMFVSLPSDVLP